MRQYASGGDLNVWNWRPGKPVRGSSTRSVREQLLTPHDVIAVCFENAQARCHVEAVSIQEIAASFRSPIAALLTYDQEAALQWRYCAHCAHGDATHACLLNS
jgi:hypothetical protein